MRHAHDLSLTPLARHALLALPGGAGRAVGVFSGRVWITEEGEWADHVLDPGDSLVLRRPGLALVEGLQDSQLILFEAPSPDAWAGAPGPVPPRRDAAPDTPTVAEYEARARELRRQAIAEALAWLAQAPARWLRPQGPSPARQPGRSWQPWRHA